jgi:hypothetical protein
MKLALRTHSASFVAALLSAPLLLATGPAFAQAPPSPPNENAPRTASNEPHREGFTLDLGLGLGYTNVAADPGGVQNFGLAPLSISLGGFLSRDVALAFRAAGTSYFRDAPRSGIRQVINGFYGGIVQVWPSDDIMIRGGAGLAIYGDNPGLGGGGLLGGYGFDAGFGYAFANFTHHSLRIAFDVFPSYYEKFPTSGLVVGSALNLEWQYY